MIFAVDFDGTTVLHRFPEIGEPAPHAIRVCQRIIRRGHKIILSTMRSGKELQQAVEWMAANKIELYGVNINPTQRAWTTSPKVYAHHYIGDDALGCPLIRPPNARPYVDWLGIEKMLDEMGI